MAKKFPILPSHPERICWGCDKYCPADSMACGNGSDRTPHLAELFGPDWMDWQPGAEPAAPNPAPAPRPAEPVHESVHASPGTSR